jgi:hypothetical protein
VSHSGKPTFAAFLIRACVNNDVPDKQVFQRVVKKKAAGDYDGSTGGHVGRRHEVRLITQKKVFPESFEVEVGSRASVFCWHPDPVVLTHQLQRNCSKFDRNECQIRHFTFFSKSSS